MAKDKFKRKLTTILSADVAGYSRLMGEAEAATVKTLEQYKHIMSELIRQHRGRVIEEESRIYGDGVNIAPDANPSPTPAVPLIQDGI